MRSKILESTVLIPPQTMGAFQALLERLNEKAARFGLDRIQVVFEEDVLYTYRNQIINGERLLIEVVPAPPGYERQRTFILKSLHIRYPIIRLGDWSVVGLIEKVEGGILQFGIDDSQDDREALARYAKEVDSTCSLPCEHCRTMRMRSKAYVLREAETNCYRLVGSSCLCDFTGVDPASVLFLAEMSHVGNFGEAQCEEMRSNAGSELFLLHYLAAVCYCMSIGPFVSASKARDTGSMATFDMAFSELNKPSRKFLQELPRWDAEAIEVMQWCEELQGADSYEQNLKAIFAGRTVRRHPRQLALAASAVQSMRRANASTSQHVGAVGEELCTLATVQQVFEQANPFGRGLQYTIHLVDNLGNQLRWRTTSVPDPLIRQVGNRLSIRCKVKKHEIYGGGARTEVIRLTLNQA